MKLSDLDIFVAKECIDKDEEIRAALDNLFIRTKTPGFFVLYAMMNPDAVTTRTETFAIVHTRGMTKHGLTQLELMIKDLKDSL